MRTPIWEAPQFVWDRTVETASIIVRIPEKMAGVMQAAFGSGERDPNGPISVVGVGRIGGEVAALDVPADEGGNWLKLAQLVLLIASLNLALFVFNLIPLLPLDGGHVAGAIWESIKKGWARAAPQARPGLRRRRQGPADRLRHVARAHHDVGPAHLRRHRQADRHLRLRRLHGEPEGIGCALGGPAGASDLAPRWGHSGAEPPRVDIMAA